MNDSNDESHGSPLPAAVHRGPHPGIVAVVFTVLFVAGLYFVTALSGKPYYPGPAESVETIATFFKLRSQDALTCTALQFASAVPLAIYTATMTSRLRFLGVKAAGVDIAFVGGLLTSANLMIGCSVGWALTYPEVVASRPAVQALYRIGFGIGGVGYSVPLGLLIAGLAVTGGLSRRLPRWLMVSGIVIGVIGELSWLDMLFRQALPLIPLTRFPGFLWLAAAGFSLPNVRLPESRRSA